MVTWIESYIVETMNKVNKNFAHSFFRLILRGSQSKRHRSKRTLSRSKLYDYSDQVRFFLITGSGECCTIK